jgi:hypothetical protein
MTIADFSTQSLLREAQEEFPHINFTAELVSEFLSLHCDVQVNSVIGAVNLLADWVVANDLTEVTP